MTILHRVPKEPGEAAFPPPAVGDPRVAPFLDTMFEAGLIDGNGVALRRFDVRRGYEAGHYFWRVTWEEGEE